MTNIKKLPRPLLDVYAWQSRGRCREAESALFFEANAERGSAKRQREAAAKKLCADCPVTRECLAYALRVGEDYGVWGGLSTEERHALQRAAAS